MTEGQQIEANYNVCFILDMSSSMSSNRVDGRDSDTRLEAAEKSIQNFIKSIESNSDFTDGSVTIAVIPFAERAGNSIEITVNRVDGKTSYSYGGQDNLTFEQLSINLKSACL